MTLWAWSLLSGCSGGETKTDSSPTSDVDTSDTGGTDEPPAPEAVGDSTLEGTYYLSFAIDVVGGLVVPFQAEIDSTAYDDGSASIETFTIRAVDADEVLSDLLGTVTDTPFNADGGFTLDLGSLVLPGAFSPTGSDVEIQSVLHAQVQDSGFFCGDITGEIVTFEVDLAGSTFAAVPWDERSADAPSSCSGISEELTPIETCPTLTGGLVDDFVSGGKTRSFEVVLPTAYDASQQWPVVFGYHGINNEYTQLLNDQQLREWADPLGAIVVAPQALDRAGALAWDTFSDDGHNEDLQLFDDMLTCLGESFTVDPERVWVTGISNGGFMAGMLTVRRPEVVASAVPISGGITVDYGDPEPRIPVLVAWGGEEDSAFGQDFHALSTEMIDTLTGAGHFVVACNHGEGHHLDSTFWPWVLQFLVDHPAGVDPEPYADGLPSDFPAFCEPL